MLERTDLLIRSVVLVREGVKSDMIINWCPVIENAEAKMKLGPFGLAYQ